MDYAFFQEYWWLLVSVLGALLVFLLFVQGGQSLFFSIGKEQVERKLLVNSVGRKWEFTFTTLVVFGGGFFASFPLFYSTSFGGAYWVWMLILFCFIIQAVSYEYQNKNGNVLGSRTYQIFLFINGLLAPILLGAAVSTFFTGSTFVVNRDAIADLSGANQIISQWLPYKGLQLHGLEAVLNVWNVVFGLAVFFLSRTTALLFFIGVVLVLAGILLTLLKEGFRKGIWLEGIGVVLTALALLLIAGWNNTSFYPAYSTEMPEIINNSLNIRNSSSSPFTLKAMSVVSLLIPFVLAYIVYAWRALDLHKITRKEILDPNGHNY